MELSSEQIKSLVQDVTKELSERGVLPAPGVRSSRTVGAAPLMGPGAGTGRNVGRAYGSKTANGNPEVRGMTEYGNLSVRPGEYSSGFAGSTSRGWVIVPPRSKDSAPMAKGELNNGPQKSRGVVDDVDTAVRLAKNAQVQLADLPLHVRAQCIENIRRKCRNNVRLLAELAVSETGMGRVEDKIKKNQLVIDQTPGIEDLEPHVYTGDHGITLTEWAPYGVIGAAGPSTNPSETIINNGIGMIAGGNGVVFASHPSAKRVCQTTVSLLNEAVVEAGGPDNIITMVAEPTIESAQAMMRHADTRILVVTGGPGVVREAMSSGKKVIAAGPGNPPRRGGRDRRSDQGRQRHRAGRLARQQHHLYR